MRIKILQLFRKFEEKYLGYWRVSQEIILQNLIFRGIYSLDADAIINYV